MTIKVSLVALLPLAVAWGASAQNITHTINVTTPFDVQGNPAECSLREAFENVNQGAQVGSNTCGKPATQAGSVTRISLLKVPGEIAYLDQPIVHDHREAQLFAGYVDGGGTTRLFTVRGDATHLYTDSLVLQNARSTAEPGAAVAVLDGASLTLRRTLVRANTVTGGSGGGVYADTLGKIAFSNVSVVDNFADAGGGVFLQRAASVSMDRVRMALNRAQRSGGAAAFAEGFKVVLTNSRFENNEVTAADASGGGGAIATRGTMVVLRTNFEGNNVSSLPEGSLGGGAILALDGNPFPAVQINDSRFHGNSASVQGGDLPSGGGAIRNFSSLAVQGTTLSANFADGVGGAIMGVADSPFLIRNVSMLDNAAGSGEGAALWLRAAHGPWAPDANSILGGIFRAVVLESTVAGNVGTDQIHLTVPAADAQPVLFINNIVDSKAGVAGCGGVTAKLMVKRPNDNSPGVYNAQFPGTSCGANVPVEPASLGGVQQGWYFDMNYRRTLLQKFGDTVICDFLLGVDQFDNKRACLMGAVEAPPKAVFQPQLPWWP